jgi:hypothetical protein
MQNWLYAGTKRNFIFLRELFHYDQWEGKDEQYNAAEQADG